jgi:hypothetical protein
MREKQFSLFDDQTKKRYNRTTHGGTVNQGQRKLERPLSTRKSIHLVLKSDKAKGKFSFLNPHNKLLINRILKEKSRKFGVTINDQANVGNHLHLKLRITSRETFQKFLISVTGLIARKITGARKGKPFGRFWQGLAFTRVVRTKLEEIYLNNYLWANRSEANIAPAARDRILKAFNEWVRQNRRPPKRAPA